MKPKPAKAPVKPYTNYDAFDKLIEGVQVINRKWRYHYVNDAVAKQGKQTRKQLLGQSIKEKYPGIEKTEMFSLLRRCMKERSPHHLINEFNFPDGSKGWFELSIQPVPEGVVILSFDITPQKRAEAQLAAQLAERTRMFNQISEQQKQLQEFCQMVAHNLRAPLSNLMLLSDMIEQTDSREEKLMYLNKQKPMINFFHESFEELVEAAQVKTDLTVQREWVDMETQLQKILNLLQGDILKTQAKLTWNFSKAGSVFFPARYFDNILFSLLSNAIKYRSPERIPEIQIKSAVKNDWVYLEVKDNGLGLDTEKNKEKLFRLRKTFHGNADAKGFDLFMAKTQVESMGGNISMQSIPGKGSTFIIKLYKTEKS